MLGNQAHLLSKCKQRALKVEKAKEKLARLQKAEEETVEELAQCNFALDFHENCIFAEKKQQDEAAAAASTPPNLQGQLEALLRPQLQES